MEDSFLRIEKLWVLSGRKTKSPLKWVWTNTITFMANKFDQYIRFSTNLFKNFKISNQKYDRRLVIEQTTNSSSLFYKALTN